MAFTGMDSPQPMAIAGGGDKGRNGDVDTVDTVRAKTGHYRHLRRILRHLRGRKASPCGRSIAFRGAEPSLCDPENVAFGRECRLVRGAREGARGAPHGLSPALRPTRGEAAAFAEPRAPDHAELRQRSTIPAPCAWSIARTDRERRTCRCEACSSEMTSHRWQAVGKGKLEGGNRCSSSRYLTPPPAAPRFPASPPARDSALPHRAGLRASPPPAAACRW